MKKRLIALVLATCTVFSLLSVLGPVAGAALAPSTGADLALKHQYLPDVTQYNRYVSQMSSSFVKSALNPENCMQALNFISEMEFQRHGEVSLEELEGIQYTYNTNLLSRLYRQADLNPQNGFFTTAVITEVPSEGILRLIDDETGEFIVDYKGQYPFVRVAGDVSVSNDTVFNNSNKWIRFNSMNDFKQVVVLSETELARMCADLNTYYKVDCTLHTSDGIEFILMGRNSAYANYAGKPYVALRQNTVTEVVRPPVTEDNILIQENNGLVIDQNNGTLNLIDDNGKTIGLNIENMELDLSSPHYTIDASQSYKEGDKTYFIHFKYEVTYNITNTYITYIGANEPYGNEEYELYYQLPDGRSSADLTAAEIEGMSFEFRDVMNYQRSTDDVSVRGLYHFDGNIDDSSYFVGQGSFTWNSGASITYMDSGAFEGCLYLDNTAHSFDIDLPSNIGKKDFQIQFRYYQASEIDTQNNVENKLTFGDATLSWDESSLYFQGSKVADLPIGTWNEIALTRYNGTFYVYLNGLRVGSGASSSYSCKMLSFIFGSTSRAYTMLDELRVLSVCPIAGSASYDPSVVPFDSNLVLVLPGEKIPIADSYFQVNPDPNDLLGGKHNYTGLLTGNALPSSVTFFSSYGSKPSGVRPTGGGLWVEGTGRYASASAVDGGIRFSAIATSTEHASYHTRYDNLLIGLEGVVSANTTYTVTLVSTSGDKQSFTFTSGSTVKKWSSSGTTIGSVGNVTKTWATGSILGASIHVGNVPTYLNSSSFDSYPVIAIKPTNGTYLDIAYIELVKGSSSKLTVEEVTAVYPGVDLKPNTAAIKSFVPVKGYQVGGVRPSLPSRGDCWFPVMDNRIASVQIYTGTHWEEVSARWWTGTRWIPIYAFDINTLEDMFDIADGDSTVPLLPDGTDTFLRWWQIQWVEFRNWLEDALSNIGSGGTTIPDEEELPGEDAGEGDDHGWSFVDLIYQTKDGIWAVTKGIVQTAAGGITGLVLLIGDAGSFFEPFQSDHPEGIFGALNYGGDDIWD